jgi:hypothetical protein
VSAPRDNFNMRKALRNKKAEPFNVSIGGKEYDL